MANSAYQSSYTGAQIDTAIGAVSGKAEKSEMSVVAGTGANADKTTITLKTGTSATVLTTHQDISGKANSATTLSGYGITDAFTQTQCLDRFYALYGGTKLNNSLSSTNRINLSDYSDTGNYYCTTSADSAYIDGRPTSGDNAFRMWVSSTTGVSATYKRQRFQNFASPDIYERTKGDSGVWTNWYLVQANLADYASASDVTTLQGYFTNGVANSAATASTASALAASKTLWGQSFDGSANVSGNMTGVGTIDASGSITTNDNIYISNNKGIQIKDSGGTYQSTMYIASSNNFQIGNDTAAAGYATFINGNTITFRYSTSRTIGMVINASGNIGIGVTSPTCKLDVSGDAAISGSLSLGGTPVVKVFSGSTAPSSSTGSNGDIYIQTT